MFYNVLELQWFHSTIARIVDFNNNVSILTLMELILKLLYYY